MIRSFRHLLYEKGDRRKIAADQADKIERILARLDQASEPGHMNLPGYRLRALKGKFAGRWAVSVSGNGRIVFRFEQDHASEVVDYH